MRSAQLLRVGMYDGETGERLPMVDPHGDSITDNAFAIPLALPRH